MVGLGIEYLSAVLKKSGHSVDLVIDPQGFSTFSGLKQVPVPFYRNKMIKKILKNNPDIIAFSVTSDNIKWAYNIAKDIKLHSSVPVVFGGIQATLIPEKVISHSFIDFVVVGEGEYAFLELVNTLENERREHKIQNIWHKKNGNISSSPPRELIADLDSLPFPDKSLFPPARYYSVITGRGCLGECTYCCSPYLKKIYKDKGKFLRRRSPGNVITELEAAKERYNIRRIIFEDDLFVYNKDWLSEFVREYRNRISLPCVVCGHPSFIDEEMASYLDQISCCLVEIGVQSLNENIRRSILRRFYGNDKVIEAINLLKQKKICCAIDNIVGLPGESVSDIIQMLRFYNEIRPGKIDVFYLKHYPKLDILNMKGVPSNVVDEINNGEILAQPVVKSGENLPNTDLKKVNKLLVVISLIHLLPKAAVRFIINRKLYRFLPAIKNT
jgi:radical SAM superfamily enzyme YgiQ (UPF0313 family)